MNKNERLAAEIRGQLDSDENLLCCEIKGRNGMGFLIVGVLLLLFAFYPLSQDYLETGYSISFGISGILFVIPGLLKVLTWNKNYYYVTNKKLCIVSSKGTQNIPLETIQNAQKARGGGKKSRYYYISVQLKDGNEIKLIPDYRSIDLMLESLQNPTR
jgi:hypothetical protein